jgi:hypothetical protein
MGCSQFKGRRFHFIVPPDDSVYRRAEILKRAVSLVYFCSGQMF